MCDYGMSSSDDIRTGYILGYTFDYKPVQYSVVDGMAVFEGCIILGSAAEMAQVTADIQRMSEASEGHERIAHGVALTGQQFRWSNSVVPYIIDPNLPNQDRVTDAIAHWEQRTNIRFKSRTAANADQYPNYVNFRPSAFCRSWVGMRGGKQDIELAWGCTTGNAIHEIGHAMGLWHEQSREDRDSFVKINWQNIETDRDHNFNQHIHDGDDIGDYDFGSIMHYGPTAFAKTSGLVTIEALQAGVTFGQREQLSPGDVAAIKAMYPGGDPEIVIPEPGSQLNDATVNFQWTASGEEVLQWWLYVGTSPERYDIFNSGSLGTSVSRTVTGLPTDGHPLYVRLWYKTVDRWQHHDYQYIAAVPTVPAMTVPAPGSTLVDSDVAFHWSANGTAVLEWWLYAGTAEEKYDHYNSGSLGTSVSKTVVGLPTDSKPIFIRLWYRTANGWESRDYQYQAAPPRAPAMTDPTPGTELSDSTVTFRWTANGSAVIQWWLYVGSAQEEYDRYNSGSLGTNVATTVAGLPRDRSQLHVRLWYRMDDGWRFLDYQYTAAAP